MDKETIRHLLRNHRELWEWVSERPGRERYGWPRWCGNGGDIPLVKSGYCFLCGFIERGQDCDACPADWSPASKCYHPGGLYYEWRSAAGSLRAEAARMMRDVPLKLWVRDLSVLEEGDYARIKEWMNRSNEADYCYSSVICPFGLVWRNHCFKCEELFPETTLRQDNVDTCPCMQLPVDYVMRVVEDIVGSKELRKRLDDGCKNFCVVAKDDRTKEMETRSDAKAEILMTMPEKESAEQVETKGTKMVYCGECVFLSSTYIDACDHPENIYKESNWLKMVVSHKRQACDINGNNDCVRFKKRGERRE